MSKIILFDTEMTAWEGSLQRDWSESWEFREIIQVSALKVDLKEEAVILEEFDSFIRPQKNPILSDYIKELTGISQENVAGANGFEEVLYRFYEFSEFGNLHCYCWGIDGEIIGENCHLHGIPMPDFESGFHDLKPFIQNAGIDTTAIYSGDLSRHLGLEQNPSLHHALEDTRSLFISLKHLITAGLVDTEAILSL